MIIDYDNNSPEIPRDPITDEIDWLGVKQMALRQGDWYARGASIVPDNQRLVNLYYIYAWFKYSGYAPISSRAVASMMWYESGYDGSQWGSGRVASDTPYGNFQAQYVDGHQGDPDYFLYYAGFTKIYASNWQTLPESAPPNFTIVGADLMTNPTILTFPSYGLVQWTPYTALRGHSTDYGNEVGENWFNAYLNDSSLQCFILDWEQKQADATPPDRQYGENYKGEWVDRRGVGDYPDIVEVTWANWKNDSYLSDVQGTADDLFLNSCHQFIVHYVHGNPYERDTDRLTVLHQYIDNAFTIWDNNGGAGLMDMPPPMNTHLDPWHMSLYTLMSGRRKKNVRTVLL